MSGTATGRLPSASYLRPMLQCFTADYVFPISGPPLRNGTVVADETGQILEVLPPEKNKSESFGEDTVHRAFSGILCPGFINAHCHLELSHLKGKFETGQTLPGFIGQMLKSRDAEKEVIEKAMIRAEEEMIANGIVGVGDICNTADSAGIKKRSRLRYHNFIELFDIVASNSEKEFEKGIALAKQFEGAGDISLTPHAPYTVTPQLLKRIYEYAYRQESLHAT